MILAVTHAESPNSGTGRVSRYAGACTCPKRRVVELREGFHENVSLNSAGKLCNLLKTRNALVNSTAAANSCLQPLAVLIVFIEFGAL